MSIALSLKDLFPYKRWRKGQLELAKEAYKISKKGGILLVNYPTGSGKTAAVLTGTLSAALENNLRIFYLVKTKNQLVSPLNELRKICGKTNITFSCIYNKKDMCLFESLKNVEYDDFLRYCSFMVRNNKCPFYKKASILEEASLQEVDVMSFGKEIKACPYELAKKMASRATIIVTVYNYLFHPDIRTLLEYDLGYDIKKSVIIVDEGHNLSDSITGMLTKELRKSWLVKARKEVLKLYKGEEKEIIIQELTKLLSYFKFLERKLGEKSYLEIEHENFPVYDLNPEALFKVALIIEQVEEGRLITPSSYTRKIAEFWKELHKHRASRIIVAERDFTSTIIRLTYVIPPLDTTKPLREAYAAVIMSGTLPPEDYLVSTLGLQSKNITLLTMPSLYANNIKVLGIRNISSRYVERDERNFVEMGHLIREVYRSVPTGIVMAVFPSYDYLKCVLPYVKVKDVLVERETTSIKDVTSMIGIKDKVLIACSAWGKIAEGIEVRIKEESLIKAIVIAGLPIPEPSSYRKKFYEIMFARTRDRDKAWRHTYVTPAIMKVIQALGRSIRSERDKAIAVLLDERFFDKYILNVMSSYGYKIEEIEPKLLKNKILSFFNKA